VFTVGKVRSSCTYGWRVLARRWRFMSMVPRVLKRRGEAKGGKGYVSCQSASRRALMVIYLCVPSISIADPGFRRRPPRHRDVSRILGVVAEESKV
jgi:hypothetical protein